MTCILFPGQNALGQSPHHAGLIAHYPLSSDGNDITGNEEPMTLTNTPFQEGGIYCNGIYPQSGNPDYCLVTTPSLEGFDFKMFSISARFKVTESLDVNRPVFVGGQLYRWIGFYLRKDGTVAMKYNNNNYAYSAVHYSLNTWHEATVTYDSTTGTGKLYLDDTLACTVDFQIVHGSYNKDITISDYSNASTFKGIFSDLKIYGAIINPSECERGDVNCDGSITPGDALCAFWRSILGSFREECDCGCSEEVSDVNCDGQITPGDALCIFWRSILGDWQDECECQP